MARRMWRRWAGRASWLSVRSWRRARQPSPGRSSTLSSIECDTSKLDVSGSGSATTRRSKVASPQDTKPSGAFLRTSLRRFFGSSPALSDGLLVLGHVLGRLDDDRALEVVSGPPRPAGDLVELTGGEVAGAGAVVLGQRREQHGADRHVDADAERVGAADHLEQPRLGQLLHEAAVLGQQASVVHAHAAAHEARERLAEPAGEPEVADQVGDADLLLAGAEVGAHQLLGPLDGRRLGEVHDVDRRLVVLEEVLDGLEHGREAERPVERHRTSRRAHGGGGTTGAAGEVGFEPGDVAEGRRHQDVLGVGQREQGHLPGPPRSGSA